MNIFFPLRSQTVLITCYSNVNKPFFAWKTFTTKFKKIAGTLHFTFTNRSAKHLTESLATVSLKQTGKRKKKVFDSQENPAILLLILPEETSITDTVKRTLSGLKHCIAKLTNHPC